MKRQDLTTNWPDLFQDGPIHTARAPGRLDVMGGIADYSGSLVFELPLACGTQVAVQGRTDGRFVLASRCLGDEAFRAEFEADELLRDGVPAENDGLADVFTASAERKWAAYGLGPILHAARIHGQSVEGGLSLVALSDVPLGAGLSSSASLEVAALTAAYALWQQPLDGRVIALLAQEAENTIARAPCGIMDQMTCALGMERHFMALLCQPHEIIGYHGVPDGIALVGINTGVRHAVGGSDYADVRTAAFMGQKILLSQVTEGRRRPDPYGGYLSNIFVNEYLESYRDLLPDEMSGAEFLAEFGRTNDTVTTVDPERVYRVRAATEHPIYENERVFKFLALMEAAHETPEREFYRQAGRLMRESHASYRDGCRLSCDEADWLVAEVERIGPDAGLYGAKITGGGSGGTVAVLASAHGRERIPDVVRGYEDAFGHRPEIVEGSSPGCMRFRVETL